MLYKEAYLYLFNRLGDIIQLMESIDDTTEHVDVALLLKQLQAEAEERCTAGDGVLDEEIIIARDTVELSGLK